ncbi:transcriptional regulatory protein AlgP-like isoform X1 [Acipenser oxyrinchus oxyrinchus]|uniref:Transcriptional regulatory protein AlgP-like isoform X1 n=1 Tax=Acipenser oxyrinchus oxyrinchus TaxID=40147 RepID=A0AAD8DDN7_ACIOX|nr:transcriptional regulatory protein AlgP-like isoform X1 [Acipenser oxyrinchus oxyrinchus]
MGSGGVPSSISGIAGPPPSLSMAPSEIPAAPKIGIDMPRTKPVTGPITGTPAPPTDAASASAAKPAVAPTVCTDASLWIKPTASTETHTAARPPAAAQQESKPATSSLADAAPAATATNPSIQMKSASSKSYLPPLYWLQRLI